MRAGGFSLLLGAALLVLLLGFSVVPTAEDTTAPSDVHGWIGQAPTHTALSADDGEKIYMTRCMSCHQANGNGISGVFPPLDGTEWVVGDKGRIIRIVLDGMMGEVEVQGIVYSGAMPPWKTFLKDDEVAAVLNYIRNSWNNEADEITAEEVALVREATKDRKTSWTAAELKDDANLGIPGAKDDASGDTPR